MDYMEKVASRAKKEAQRRFCQEKRAGMPSLTPGEMQALIELQRRKEKKPNRWLQALNDALTGGAFGALGGGAIGLLGENDDTLLSALVGAALGSGLGGGYSLGRNRLETTPQEARELDSRIIDNTAPQRMRRHRLVEGLPLQGDRPFAGDTAKRDAFLRAYGIEPKYAQEKRAGFLAPLTTYGMANLGSGLGKMNNMLSNRGMNDWLNGNKWGGGGSRFKMSPRGTSAQGEMARDLFSPFSSPNPFGNRRPNQNQMEDFDRTLSQERSAFPQRPIFQLGQGNSYPFGQPYRPQSPVQWSSPSPPQSFAPQSGQAPRTIGTVRSPTSTSNDIPQEAQRLSQSTNPKGREAVNRQYKPHNYRAMGETAAKRDRERNLTRTIDTLRSPTSTSDDILQEAQRLSQSTNPKDREAANGLYKLYSYKAMGEAAAKRERERNLATVNHYRRRLGQPEIGKPPSRPSFKERTGYDNGQELNEADWRRGATESQKGIFEAWKDAAETINRRAPVGSQKFHVEAAAASKSPGHLVLRSSGPEGKLMVVRPEDMDSRMFHEFFGERGDEYLAQRRDEYLAQHKRKKHEKEKESPEDAVDEEQSNTNTGGDDLRSEPSGEETSYGSFGEYLKDMARRVGLAE
jgi:hypothetical protein